MSLTAFPAGAVTRTVFGKIEIILYRVEEETFRVECWRSFAEYAFGMLAEGVYLAPSAYEAGFVSSALSDADLDATIAAAARVFARID